MTSQESVRMTRRDVVTTGLVTYSRLHLKASIAFNKRIFADGVSPPASLLIATEGLRVPVEHDEPRRLAERAHRAREKAHRARERADHLAGVANRHAQRLARVS